MSYLFKIENSRVYPEPEILLIDPFKEIWARDESTNKFMALNEFSYIEFMTSMLKSNPYRQYPEDRKHDVIKEGLGLPNKWKPDFLVKDGLNYMKKIQQEGSSTYRYYLASKVAVEKLESTFINLDMNELTDKGAFRYKPKDITTALNDTEKILSSLKALEKKVNEEIYEDTKTKSTVKLSVFSNDNLIKNIS